MIYLIIVIILMGVGIYFLFQSNRKKGKEISSLNKVLDKKEATIGKLEHVIAGIQEVNRETIKKKKKIRTGSNSDKFNNSLDILSDMPTDSGAGKD